MLASDVDRLLSEPGQLARLLRAAADRIEAGDRPAIGRAPADDPDPIMDLKGTARYAQVSPRMVRRWANLPPEQALPCYRTDGRVLFRRSEVDAFIERFRSRGRPSLTRALQELGLYAEEAEGA
jgi:hypothetical protein